MLINQYSIKKLKILKENPTIKYYSINFGLSGLLITDCNVANRFFSSNNSSDNDVFDNSEFYNRGATFMNKV
jgi:hypothetical protein